MYKWLKVAARDVPGCRDDRLVIAFARFGKLGMGGGGIANVGRPDKSVTVHEFGHSFVGLLDEYSNNPGTPPKDLRAPNASTTSDRDKVPWAHFLKKKFPGIDVELGGATYYKGVWKPSNDCAMNSAGHVNYCAVCREAAVLRIYSYVSPIDAYSPSETQELEVTANTDKFLAVTPMKPRSQRARRRLGSSSPSGTKSPCPSRSSGRREEAPTACAKRSRGPTGGSRGKEPERAASLPCRPRERRTRSARPGRRRTARSSASFPSAG